MKSLVNGLNQICQQMAYILGMTIKVGLKKEELENCAYYHGVRFRGHGIAQWDEKIGKFLILAYEFNTPVVERLEHFVDVIENRLDGFVPIEKIDKNKYYDIRKMDPKKIEEEEKCKSKSAEKPWLNIFFHQLEKSRILANWFSMEIKYIQQDFSKR